MKLKQISCNTQQQKIKLNVDVIVQWFTKMNWPALKLNQYIRFEYTVSMRTVIARKNPASFWGNVNSLNIFKLSLQYYHIGLEMNADLDFGKNCLDCM